MIKRSISVWDILVASSTISKNWCVDGVAYLSLLPYGMSSSIFTILSTIKNTTFPGKDPFIVITKYLCIFSRVVVIFAIFFILYVNNSKNAKNNVGINI